MESEVASWRWVVLVASFFNMLLNASLGYHIGVLNIVLLEDYDAGVFMTSWLMSLYISVFGVAAPLGSIIINISNCRTCVFLSGILSLVGFVSSSFVTRPEWLFLTIVLIGIGQSLSFVGGTVVLAFYFPSLNAIANYISSIGAGLGSFVHPVLLQALVDEYRLSGAFLILGGVAFNSCVTALIFRPTELEIQRHKSNSQDSKQCHVSFCGCLRHLFLLKHPAFICLTLSVFAFSISNMEMTVYLPEYLVIVKELSLQEASLMASLVGTGSIISRLFTGFAAADPKIEEEHMFIGLNAVSFFVCVIATTLMSFHAGIHIFSLVYGFYGNATKPLLNPLTFRVLGYDKAPSGYGILLLALGCGSLVGPPLSASLVKKFGYEALFQFSGTMFLLASILGTVPSLVPVPSPKSTTPEIKILTA